MSGGSGEPVSTRHAGCGRTRPCRVSPGSASLQDLSRCEQALEVDAGIETLGFQQVHRGPPSLHCRPSRARTGIRRGRLARRRSHARLPPVRPCNSRMPYLAYRGDAGCRVARPRSRRARIGRRVAPGRGSRSPAYRPAPIMSAPASTRATASRTTSSRGLHPGANIRTRSRSRPRSSAHRPRASSPRRPRVRARPPGHPANGARSTGCGPRWPTPA